MPQRAIADVQAGITRLAAACDEQRREQGAPLIRALDELLGEPGSDHRPAATETLAWVVQGDLGEALADLEDLARRFRVIAGTTEAEARRDLGKHQAEAVERAAALLDEIGPGLAAVTAAVDRACTGLDPWLPGSGEPCGAAGTARHRLATRLRKLHDKLSEAGTELRTLQLLAGMAGVLAEPGPEPAAEATPEHEEDDHRDPT